MGLLNRFQAALARTRDKLAAGLGGLGLRKAIDESGLAQLERALLAADVGPLTTRTLIAELRGAWTAGTLSDTGELLPILRQRLAALWPAESRQLRLADSGPSVVVLAGINGSGKTTSLAKLARYLQARGKSVLIGACDTYRAAAIDQLAVWAQRLGAALIRQQPGSDPGAVAYEACAAAEARGIDVVLLDTAGRLHTQDHLMRELGKIVRVAGKRIAGAPHEVLLVLDATIGQNALAQAELFKQHAQVTGIILAKLDGSAKGGVVIGIRERWDVPVKFVGIGEGLDDLEPFDPEPFVEALFAAG